MEQQLIGFFYQCDAKGSPVKLQAFPQLCRELRWEQEQSQGRKTSQLKPFQQHIVDTKDRI